MLERIKNSKNAFFIFGYSTYMIYQILSYSFYSMHITGLISRLVMILVIYCCMINELMNSNNAKNKLLVVAVILILTYVVVGINQYNVLIMILLIYSGRNLDFRTICRLTIYITVFTVVFVILSGYFGIIRNYVGYRGDGTPREYLGFRYSLFGPGLLLNALTVYIYVNHKMIKLKRLAIFVLINYWLYAKTDSRLAFILAMIVIAIEVPFCLSKDFEYSASLYDALRFVFIIMFLVSLMVTLYYDSNSKIWNWINTLFTNRPYYMQKSYETYGFNLFGNRFIEWDGFAFSSDGTASIYSDSMIYVDNVYINIAQRYGLIFTSLTIIILTYHMFRLNKTNEKFMILLLATISLHGLIDNQIFYLCYNTFLLSLINKSYSQEIIRDTNIPPLKDR